MTAFRIATLAVGALLLGFAAWLGRPRPYNIGGGLETSGVVVAGVGLALVAYALFVAS